MADGDIPKVKVNPNTHHEGQDTIVIHRYTNTMIVTQRDVDASGKPVGKETNEIFMDRANDPDTPEDESSTEYTDLIAEIDKGNNMELTIKNAIVARRNA